MVCPDYCTIYHLQAGVAAPAVVESFQHQLPQAGQRPAPELPVDRRPFTKVLVQIAPSNARPGNLENLIQNKTVVPACSLRHLFSCSAAIPAAVWQKLHLTHCAD